MKSNKVKEPQRSVDQELLEIAKDYLTFREARGMDGEFTAFVKQVIDKAEGRSND